MLHLIGNDKFLRLSIEGEIRTERKTDNISDDESQQLWILKNRGSYINKRGLLHKKKTGSISCNSLRMLDIGNETKKNLKWRLFFSKQPKVLRSLLLPYIKLNLTIK